MHDGNMNNRTVAILCWIAGTLFALASGMNAFSAYREHQKNQPAGFYIAMAVTYTALCVVFLALGCVKSRKSN